MRAVERLDFPLVAEKPEYNPEKKYGGRMSKGKSDVCEICPMLNYCRIRVEEGRWVMCEIPDELDMLRVNGGLQGS